VTDPRARLGGAVVDVPVPGGFVRTESLGQGPALLLLHGWTLDRRLWTAQLSLAKHLRLILIDRRGCGQSTAPPDLAREPDDVLAIADTLHLDRLSVGGLSQGARVAVGAARRAPHRIMQLFVMAAPLDDAPGPEDPPAPVAAMQAAAAHADQARLATLWRGHPFLETGTQSARRLVEQMIADYAGRDLLAPATDLPVDSARLRQLAMPVTALVGDRDSPRRQAAAATIAQSAPAGRLVVVPEAGHLCNLDQPDLVNRLLATAG
jgi:pimeloyl-ACP methyl ester carboxylesterase